MVRNVIDALEPDRPQSTPALEPLVDLGRTRLEMVLKVLDVDGAVRRVKGGWVSTGQQWDYDEPRYRKLDEARQARAAGDARLPEHDGCRMAFLRSQLDDPELAAGDRCGRCDNCAGTRYERACRRARPELRTRRIDAARRRARAAQAMAIRTGKLGVDLSGEIGDGPATGRVIGRLTDLGWGARLRSCSTSPTDVTPTTSCVPR